MKSLQKSFSLFLACCFFVQLANAVPAYPRPVEYKQPDGSVVTITLKGDEYVHWAITPDDYTLLPDKNGFFEYAVKNAAGDLVLSGIRMHNEKERKPEEKAFLQRTPKKLTHSARQVREVKTQRVARAPQQTPSRMIAKPQTPFTGEKHAPVILVDFPGKPFKKTKAEFEALMNQIGYSQGTATGSVRDYFLASSYGQLDYQVDVYGPYTLSQTIGNYDDSNGGNPTQMAYEAILAACNDGCNLSAYDSDNDGIVDGVHIIFAGYGQEAGAPVGQSIWAHASFADLNGLGGKQGTRYSCSPELRGINGSALAPMGTLAHELGHVFGLPDLYDIDYEGSGGQAEGLGNWDIMANGSWNNNGDTPSYHSAWCKDFLGWVTAQELTEPAEITLPNPAEQGVIYRINTQTPNEYFLLENRQQQGWDTYLPGSGMVIYHVDENYAGWNNNMINADPSHQGLYTKSSTPFPAEGFTKFTDNSIPNSKSWAGENTNKPITLITRDIGNKTISFDFMKGEGEEEIYTWQIGYPNAADVTATLSADGTFTISGRGNMQDFDAENQNPAPWTFLSSDIKTVIIEEGVTNIGRDVFYDCTPVLMSAPTSYPFLTSVTVPSSVKSIGGCAFYYCTSLTDLILSEGVTTIGYGAFRYCYSLTKLTFPNSVTSIESDAFQNCPLGSVAIPSGITNIGTGAFSGCHLLTAINVDEGNKNFSSEDGVLFNKNKTTLLIYPSFKDGETYSIPEGVITIGEFAFYMSQLKSVHLPGSITTIESSAFDCYVNAVNVDEGNMTFSSEDGVVFDKYKTTLIIYPAFKDGEEYSVPEGVTTLEMSAFFNCQSLTSITLPSSVTSIKTQAFIFCNSLKLITVKNMVPPKIDSGSFYAGTSITDITLVVPAGTKALYEEEPVWRDFGTIEEEPDGISLSQTIQMLQTNKTGQLTATVYRNNAVSDEMVNWQSSDSNIAEVSQTGLVTAKLEGIAIITATTGDGKYLANCQVKVYSNAIAEGIVDEIYWVLSEDGTLTIGGRGAIPESYSWASGTSPWHAYVDNIKTVEIESNITTIGESAFSDCWYLTTANIPACVTNIGGGAFNVPLSAINVNTENKYFMSEDGVLFNKQKTKIISYPGGKQEKEYSIPQGVTSIGKYAFCNAALTSVIIPNSVTSIGEQAFLYCSDLTSVIIPDRVATIGYMAFAYCPSLTSVTIPDGVTTIGYMAFAYCPGLTSVTIPISVTNIERYAFGWCSGLQSVIVQWQTPLEWKDNIGKPEDLYPFEGLSLNDLSLLVPIGTKTLYETAPVWKDFGTITEGRIVLDKMEKTLQINQTEQLTATVYRNNIVSNETVNWQSSDPGVAEVSQTGLVTAKSTGTANITATTADGELTATCKVTVTASTYGVSIGTFSGGSISADKTDAEAGETVTLTIAPDEGYELNDISAYKTGDETTAVALSGSGDTRTFTMPEYGVTVTATFKKTQEQLDKEDLETLKTAIEDAVVGGNYSIAQASGNTESDVKTWLVNTLKVLFSQLYSVQFRSTASIVGDVTITSLTPAIAGTETNPEGVNGSFKVTVTLTKDEITLVTGNVSGIITATPFATVKSIELELLDDKITVRITNTGNVATGELTIVLSGENADKFTLSQTTISNLAVGEEEEIPFTLTPLTPLADGTYTATLTVSGQGLESKSTEITCIVKNTGDRDIPQVKLEAWVKNGMLHVSGLTAGKPWSVHDISGTLVYQNIATSERADIHLSVRGVFLVQSGNKTIKVLY